MAEPSPAERVAARPANEVRFDIRAGDRPVGSVELTTTGAYQATVEAEQRTVIALALKVTAVGPDPLVVKPADLRATVETDQGSFADLEVSGSSGVVSTAPGAPAVLRAHFALPRGISAAAVRRFTLAWTVTDREGVAYELATPFVQGPSGPAFAAAPPPSPPVVAAREPSRAPSAYVSPYPYRYSYGGVWYSSDVHLWPGHAPPLVFVPDHHDVHPSYGGGHYGGGHYGGGHSGGSYSGHGGGGHHGGGHHRP